jgi:glutaminyl-peptide cyclotransferase
MKLIPFLCLILITCCFSCNNNSDNDTVDKDLKSSSVPTIAAPANIGFTILAQHTKDTSAYTQGLEIYNGKLYEGTGDYENSSVRITDWKTGNVEKKHVMGSADVFGEGITIFGNKLYQLTWQSNIVYIYDIKNIDKPLRTLKWPHEGWGLTHNGKDLIISDGTDVIYFVDPETLAVRRTIKVVSHKGPIDSINELEYIDGYIFANVYQQNYIVKIDPANGNIVGIMQLDNLLPDNEKVPGRTDVLNGIAYDSTSKTLLITGKRWPKLYDVKLN